MKDYKLSEIKAICEKRKCRCMGCEFYNFGAGVPCLLNEIIPSKWQIDEEEQDDE